MRPNNCVMSYADSRRVDRFVQRVGVRQAALTLGVGEATLAAACEQGRMMKKTRDRILAAIERAEPKQ
jgi:hypothetical protein